MKTITKTILALLTAAEFSTPDLFAQGNVWKLDGNIITASDFIGSTSFQDFKIRTNNLQRLVVTKDGNVGIGTTGPSSKLDVTGKTRTTNFQMTNGAMNGYVLQSDATGNATWVNPASLSGSGWSLTGNAGINPSINFLGTSDNQPLILKVNSQLSGKIEPAGGTENLFLGYQAGMNNTTGAQNTFIGHRAGFSNTTGSYNYFSGWYSGQLNTTGSLNYFSGDQAGFSNISGSGNYFSGHAAGESNTGGSENCFIGFRAGANNISGSRNTAIGSQALISNTIGTYNVAIGYSALISNTDGSENVAIGISALNENTNGYHNVAIGQQTLVSNTTGVNNTAVGAYSLNQNTYGYQNSVLGEGSMSQNTTGFNNSATGMFSLQNNSTGSYNTSNGFQALSQNVSGSNNTAIGSNANVSSGNLSNTTAIGANAIVSQSNSMVLGDNNVSVGIGTSSPSSKLDVIGKTRTTNFQMTNGATNGYVLQSDANGNASWVNPSSFAGTGWSLTGNALTNPAINFLGTSDNQPLILKVNNQLAGKIEPDGGTKNLFLGYQAGMNNTTGEHNTFLGFQAGLSNTTGNSNYFSGIFAGVLNTSGNANCFLGGSAGSYNTTGSQNCFIGTEAGGFSTTGSQNTAVGIGSFRGSNNIGGQNVSIGFDALFGNESGSGNIAVGAFALSSNTNGYTNTAVGQQTLAANTTGVNNTAVGGYTLRSNTTGNQNSAFGSSLGLNTTGNNNTAHGYSALKENISGNNNSSLGFFAGPNAGAFDNTTALGSNSTTTASNQVRLGDASVTSIGGQVSWTTVSDSRFKNDIKENVPGLEFINKLRPVTYHLDMDNIVSFLKTPDSLRLRKSEEAKSNMQFTGFIAQEVEKAANDLNYDFSGVDKPKNENDYYGLRYAEFVVPLVKAVQEQQAMILKLEAKVNDLTKVNNQPVVLSGMDKPYLGQNIPNSFSEETKIDYYIPDEMLCNNGKLKIAFYDQLGRVIQESIVHSGFGAISVSTKNLSTGVYTYKLVVNNEVIDTKQIVYSK